MTTTRCTRRRTLSGIALAAMLAAGCSGDDSGAPATTSAPATTGAPATTAAPVSTTSSTTIRPTTTVASTTVVPTTGVPTTGVPVTSAPVSTTSVVCATTGFARTGVRDDTIPHLVAVLDDVRIGRHDCYERVVFAFRGDQLPEYAVEVRTPPFMGPPGEPIAVAGASWVWVRFGTADAHTAEGVASVPNTPIRPAGYAALTEIRQIEDFEAVVIYVIGLDAARPFRVLTFLDPPRVVVDVRTG